MRNKTFIRVMAIVALVAFVSLSIITVVPAFTARAETAQEKINNSQKKQSELKGKINSAKEKKQSTLVKKQALDGEIAGLQSKIDKLASQINASNAKISAKTAELKKAQEDSEIQYNAYYDRAKMLIQRGSITYLEILLNAESFSDLLSRISIVKQIAKYDNNRLNELKKIEEQIAAVKKELENEKGVLVNLKSQNDTQMAALKSKQNESQKLIDNLTSNIKDYEAALKAQEQAEAAAREEIRRLTATPASQGRTFVGGVFTWPSVSSYITSSYGTRTHPVTGKIKTHSGIDIGAAYGTNIYAANSGTVIVAGWNSGGYGNYVVIDHGGGITTLYGHCSSLLVSTGQSVTKGQVIAKVGSTGMSTGPHLHFEVLKNGSHTNPMAYFN